MYSEVDSFHPSLWDEERLRRQQIHFEFGDQPVEEVRTVTDTNVSARNANKKRVLSLSLSRLW